jgi:hypothetical protein
MGAEQKGHCCTEVLIVSWQLGHGNTWTAEERLRLPAITFSPLWISFERVVRRGVPAVYIPPFAKCAKDGAPGVFMWGESGKAGLGGAGGLHPTLRKIREGWGTRRFGIG